MYGYAGKLLTVNLTDGKVKKEPLRMVDEFYTECGFDLKTGWPTRAKLEELGLKDIADELYPKGRNEG